MLSKMIRLVYEAHSGQVDKSGKPYFHHPLMVMQTLDALGAPEELLLIGLGHDLFEDTDISPAILKELGFSDRVITGIDLLTKKKGQSYEEYKQRVLSSYDTMLVKLADLEHNMDLTRLSIITDLDMDRWEKYRKFREEIFDKFGEDSVRETL